MRFATAVILPFLAITAHAVPRSTVKASTSAYSIYEKLHQLPHDYTELDNAVSANQRLRLQVHLMQQNVETFEDRLMEISDPEHPDYGKHMSQAEIDAILASKSGSAGAVKKWLSSLSIVPVEEKPDYLTLDVTVAQAETLLQTTYKYYRDDLNSKRTVLRTTEYSLPVYLHDIVDFVSPTVFFGLRNKATVESEARYPPPDAPKIVTSLDPSCNTTVTPSCMSYLYNFHGYTPKNNSVLAISGFLNQTAQYTDVQKFLDEYAPKANKTTFAVELVNGGTLPQGNQSIDDIGEANLDVQYALSISYPVQNTFVSVSGTPPWQADPDDDTNTNEPYLEFLQHLLAKKDLPATVSISYGDTETSVPDFYKKKVCNLFGQLGARGVSVLIASGDEGPGVSCKTPKNETAFIPEFPSSCPFVTAVGGTVNIKPEQSWDSSSGGFSNYFSQPKYQSRAVSKFLTNHKDSYGPFAQYFNQSGRAYPDVAAQSYNYVVVLNGTERYIGGTSAATPTFAGIVALLNSDRIRHRKPTLGFLNPWLYGHKVARLRGLTDITHGRSVGCDGVIEGAGFDAVEGWDAATGLGTPNFRNLRKACQ